jgi:hypothetical protein
MCIFLFSCEQVKNEELEENYHTIATRSIYKSEKGDYEVTQQMAELFVKSNKENLPVIDVIPYKMDGITCFYIFNLEKGFKVISADTRVQPVLAESDEDQLYPDKNDNPGVKVWLEDTADRIKILKTRDPETGEDYSDLWADYRIPILKNYVKRLVNNNRDYDIDSIWVLVYNTSVDTIYYGSHEGPLLETKWGQSSPWNNKMPTVSGFHCPTGCVAVAVSQVLNYYHREIGSPNDLWHTISIQGLSWCFDHGGYLLSLDKSNHTDSSSLWSFMPNDYYGSNTDYVSYLMLDIGERLSMHYWTDGSTVYSNTDLSIPNLSSCGINSSFGAYSYLNVDNSIQQRKPVIVSARLGQTGNDGHTWVIDGCRNCCIQYTTTANYYCIHPDEIIYYPNYSGLLSYDEMMTLYPEASGRLYQVIYSVRNKFEESLHMNWGWDGDGDSWYNMLDSATWTYNGSSGVMYSFLYDRVINYNISTTQLN